jgi:4-amino-4-deoxy-L-arabinose transferase-like glycosyltransferase
MLAALMFLTCGRILFWDSFLGLIDIAYSWLIFFDFMIIWYFYQRKNFTLLFFLSYFIIAITFLLKGLPSVVFQGVTLLTLFISQKSVRKLFCWQHLVGIFLFLTFTGTYYLFYYIKNPDYFDDVILRLFTESTRKSAIGAVFSKTLMHIFTFPFEVIYHFLPWTLLIILLYDKNILRKALSNNFIRYCLLIFIANLLVYWLSPITYPRYLLMLIPLIFVVFLYLGKIHALSNTLGNKIVVKLLYIFMITLIIASSLLPVIFAGKIPVTHLYLKSLLIFLTGLLVFYDYHSSKQSSLLFTVGILLLISRISFDLFLLPYRQSISWSDKCRRDAIALAKNTKGHEMFLLTDTITIPNAYYLTRERKEILRFKTIPEKGPYYIVLDTTLYGDAFKKEFVMRIPYNSSSLYIGKFNNENP